MSARDPRPPSVRLNLSIALILSVSGFAEGARGAEHAAPAAGTIGVASWYGDRHQGRRTASGDVFRMETLSAAHRTLPLGSRAHVTNLDNGRTVEVVINDRGPHVAGRIIDLSAQAASQLGMRKRGLARVLVQAGACCAAADAPTARRSRRTAR